MPNLIAMSCESRNEIECLRLCPDSEEALTTLATNLIKILLTREERIRKADEEIAQMIVAWGRRIIQLAGCLRFHHLSGIDCIESLYKYKGTDFIKILRHFREKDDYLFLGKYIITSCINNDIKSHLLKHFIKNAMYASSEDLSTFLCEMWELRDEMPLRTDVVEELVICFPFCMEQFLLTVSENVVSSDGAGIDTLVNFELASFCELCSKSSVIFRTVLSILHELLLISDVHGLLLCFITTFVLKVEVCCKTGDIIDLFPFEHQLIITLLKFDPTLYHNDFVDSNFTKTNALSVVSHYVRGNRRIGGALLSYYPDWLPHIYNYCVQHNISALILCKKEDEEKRESYLKYILQACV